MATNQVIAPGTSLTVAEPHAQIHYIVDGTLNVEKGADLSDCIISARSAGTVHFNGGTIHGDLSGLAGNDDAQVVISGGNLSCGIGAAGSSTLAFDGTGLAFQPIGGSARNGLVTGTLSDGTPIRFVIGLMQNSKLALHNA